MGRGNRPHALCRGRCGWRAARACTSCQLDTPLPSRLFLLLFPAARCPLLACSYFQQLAAGNVLRLSAVMPHSDGADWPFSQPPYV